MKNKNAIIIMLTMLAGCGPGKKTNDVREKDKIMVAAYYFPNYHEDKRNASYHGNKWSEWELVKEAKTRFENHHQPIAILA